MYNPKIVDFDATNYRILTKELHDKIRHLNKELTPKIKTGDWIICDIWIPSIDNADRLEIHDILGQFYRWEPNNKTGKIYYVKNWMFLNGVYHPRLANKKSCFTHVKEICSTEKVLQLLRLYETQIPKSLINRDNKQ